MKGYWLVGNERGTVLFFVLGTLLFLAVFGGLAMDLAFFSTAKGELQRSMDAAALAGAGQLGSDDSVFDAVRDEAQKFAGLNPTRANLSATNPTGAITLDLNLGNDPSGNIVLGVWDGTSFTSDLSPDGSTVNAVRAQYATDVPTSWLGILGLTTLPVSAHATAIANPPIDAGCEPTLPLAVTQCSFFDAETGAFTNSGCGTGITFIRSNTTCDNSPDSPQGCNAGTWASLDGTTPSPSSLTDAIVNAANPAEGSCPVTESSGENAETNNGMLDPVFRTMADLCDGSHPSVTGAKCLETLDEPLVVNGTTFTQGWEIGVMMIETECPPGPMSGAHEVMTYSKLVITQVFYKTRGCVIDPNPDPQAAQYCPTTDNDLRAIFGYFRCDDFGDTASTKPLPRAALAPGRRLVQ
jgi:Flp pilus assembly protein TadG